MKNVLVLFLFFAFAMSSCNSSKEIDCSLKKLELASNLIGKWNLQVTGFSDNSIPESTQEYMLREGSSISYEFIEDQRYIINTPHLQAPKEGSYEIVKNKNSVILFIGKEDPKIMDVVRMTSDTLWCETFLSQTGKMIYHLTRQQ
ncbi:MAG: hypothetical protein ACPGED_11885 [Flavobacteriales bacterium]